VDLSEKTARAALQVEALTAFYIHVAAFLLVIPWLVVLNWYVTPEIWWAHWTFLGWGVGVLAHAFVVFIRPPAFLISWQLVKVIELRDRM
jgi:2TM domain